LCGAIKNIDPLQTPLYSRGYLQEVMAQKWGAVTFRHGGAMEGKGWGPGYVTRVFSPRQGISRLQRATCWLTLSIGLSLFVSAAGYAEDRASALKFVSNLKKLYLTDEVKANTSIGIEIELNGLTEAKVTEVITKLIGGECKGDRIGDTQLGDLQIYRDGAVWQYEDWANQQNKGQESRFWRMIYLIKDALTGPVEVVFPPIKFEQLELLGQVAEKLAEEGGKGTRGLAAAAIHFNYGVDPTDTKLIRNLEANYTNNGGLFRKYFRPALIRRISGFIRHPLKAFRDKLKDYEYAPTAQELWIDFREGNHLHFSRMNIGPVLLEDRSVAAEEKNKLIEEGWSHRPAVELRESDTVLNSKYITETAEMGLALVEASKHTGQLNPKDLETELELSARGHVPHSDDRSLFLDRKFGHSLTTVLEPTHFAKIRLKRQGNGKMSYVDREGLMLMGLADPATSMAELKEKFADRFGFEVVRPDDKEYDLIPDEEVIALAYDDGYLGRGDGRASWLFEVAVPGQGTYDFGTKGSGLTVFGIPQESIDKGFHIGEKDGYLSEEEAVVVLQDTWMLRSLGLESESIAGIEETGKLTGYNLNPPKPQPAAKVTRAFDNGIRGAHFRKYDPQTLKRVTLWLRQREAVRLGRGKDLPPTEVYLKNKIRRDARRAALAQHFWVVHGAINISNIYENGWADLYYVEALQVPDANYSPLNVYSRLGYQATEFYKVTKQFVDAIVSVDRAAKVDTKREYWDTYHKELQRLELISAGLEPKIAERVMEKNPDLAANYAALIWDINYNHLQTNTRKLKSDVASVIFNWNLTGSAGGNKNRRLLGRMSKREGEVTPERVFVEEMFPKDRWIYNAKQFVRKMLGQGGDRKSIVTDDKLRHLIGLTTQIATEVKGLHRLSVTVPSILKRMSLRAERVAKITLPTRAEFQENYAAYQQSGSHDLNAFLKPVSQNLRHIQSEILATYGALDQLHRAQIGKATGASSMISTLPKEQENNCATKIASQG
jgi:hypothetical protein